MSHWRLYLSFLSTNYCLQLQLCDVITIEKKTSTNELYCPFTSYWQRTQYIISIHIACTLTTCAIEGTTIKKNSHTQRRWRRQYVDRPFKLLNLHLWLPIEPLNAIKAKTICKPDWIYRNVANDRLNVLINTMHIESIDFKRAQNCLFHHSRRSHNKTRTCKTKYSITE